MEKDKRYLVEQNGVQFAGTDGGGYLVSDIDGAEYYPSSVKVIRKLTGLEAMKVGDILVDRDGDEAKVLTITNNHTALLRSCWGDFDEASVWMTFEEAEANGWKLKKDLKEDTKKELTLDEIADKFNIPVENLRIKD